MPLLANPEKLADRMGQWGPPYMVPSICKSRAEDTKPAVRKQRHSYLLWWQSGKT
jgi:hypothetical protein